MPFAQLARLQVSSAEDPKHRNVCADTFYRPLQDGMFCYPLYKLLHSLNVPCSFGYNLTDQATVQQKLRASKPLVPVRVQELMLPPTLLQPQGQSQAGTDLSTPMGHSPRCHVSPARLQVGQQDAPGGASNPLQILVFEFLSQLK